MSIERSILSFSAVGLLAQSVRLVSFCTDFTIRKLSSLLYTSQVYSFNHGSKRFRPLELNGLVNSGVGCVQCVPLPVKKKKQNKTKKRDDPTPLVA